MTFAGRPFSFLLPDVRLASIFELQGAGNARWLPMEGLRGFAVALVFIVHYASFLAPMSSAAWLPAVQELGNIGVDLFFVMSGFLIYKGCIAKPIDLRVYAWRRIERIYPTFLVALAIYLALMIAMPGASKLPAEPVDQALYILANMLLLPGMTSIDPIMTVSWSLSYEAFYYLPVPLAIIGLRMRGWTPSGRLAFFLALYGAMVLLELAGLGGKFRLSMFLGGMMLHEIVTMIPAERRRSSAGADLATFGLLAAVMAFYVLSADNPVAIENPLNGAFHPVTRLVMVNFAFVLLVYRSVFTGNGLAARAYSWTPLRWLGNVSYSFYLMHGLALHAFFMALGKFWKPADVGVSEFIVLMPFAFLASMAVTMPIYLLVERPLSLAPGKLEAWAGMIKTRACKSFLAAIGWPWQLPAAAPLRAAR